MKKLAIFDFDKTLTKKDTFFDLLFYSFSLSEIVLKLIFFLPNFIKYTFNKIDNNQAKERLFFIFFNGISEEQFKKICTNYSLTRIDKIINKKVYKKLLWHKKMKHRIVIVSASLQDWISPWANKNGIKEVIATQPEIVQSKLSGKFDGKNCHGREKIVRIKKVISDLDSYSIYSYSDDLSDKPLFMISNKAFLIKKDNISSFFS